MEFPPLPDECIELRNIEKKINNLLHIIEKIKNFPHLFDAEDKKTCEEYLLNAHKEMEEHCLKKLSKVSPSVLYAANFMENVNLRCSVLKDLEVIDLGLKDFFIQKHFRLALQAKEMGRLALNYKENV